MKLRTLKKRNVLKRNIFGQPIETQYRTYIYKLTWTGIKYLRIIRVFTYNGEPCFGANAILCKDIDEVYCTFENNINNATIFNPQEVTFLMKDILSQPNKYILRY